ncbi:MAG: cyclase family protein [Proteobacteria bacterium]|nr:cyclase family protein [Pseudomonadota bacterium]
MRIVDLSHTVSSNMPVYPGTEQPIFITGCSIDEIGFLEKKITMYSHTGTHIDAPAHLIKNAQTLDMLAIEHFYGTGLRLNFENDSSKTIDISSLEPHWKEIEKTDFLLIHTGWSKYWGDDKYFSDYPVLSTEAARWLSKFKLKGLGLDTISADDSESDDYPVHKILLHKEIIIVENLTKLLHLPGSAFNFSCFPIKFEDADGSPVRAVAYI